MREKAAVLVAFLLALFTLATAALGQMEAMLHRSVFLTMTVWLGVLVHPLGKGKSWRPAGIAVDALVALAATAAALYIHVNYEDLMMNLPEAKPHDIALASGMVLVLLEMSRRTVGLIFPCLILTGIGYALFGNLISGPLGHRGFDIAFLTETVYMGDLGIWGLLLGVAASTIAAFVLFGSVLLHTGGGRSFMDVAMLVSGRSPGGAAKIATVSSGLFGMVSGSAVANVATTGNFTIPMMRRLGYPPALAGAVEAVASTGGQIAPPIMGAGAFIMAEMIGMDYWRIALAATIPGFIYYLAVFMSIHYYARRHRLGYVPDDQLPTLKDVLHPDRLAPVAAGLLGLAAGVALG